MINPLVIIFLFIECFMLALVGGFIFKWSPKPFSAYIKYALMLGSITYLVRNIFIIFKLPMPLHALILIIISIFLMIKIFELPLNLSSIYIPKFLNIFLLNNIYRSIYGNIKKYNIAIGSTLISYVLIITCESLIAPVVMNYYHWSLETIQKNPLIYIGTGLINEIPLIIISIIAIYKKRSVYFIGDNK